MRISDWNSDVCSSDLLERPTPDSGLEDRAAATSTLGALGRVTVPAKSGNVRNISWQSDLEDAEALSNAGGGYRLNRSVETARRRASSLPRLRRITSRSDEHTSEIKSLMRISYDVF